MVMVWRWCHGATRVEHWYRGFRNLLARCPMGLHVQPTTSTAGRFSGKSPRSHVSPFRGHGKSDTVPSKLDQNQTTLEPKWLRSKYIHKYIHAYMHTCIHAMFETVQLKSPQTPPHSACLCSRLSKRRISAGASSVPDLITCYSNKQIPAHRAQIKMQFG